MTKPGDIKVCLLRRLLLRVKCIEPDATDQQFWRTYRLDDETVIFRRDAEMRDIVMTFGGPVRHG